MYKKISCEKKIEQHERQQCKTTNATNSSLSLLDTLATLSADFSAPVLLHKKRRLNSVPVRMKRKKKCFGLIETNLSSRLSSTSTIVANQENTQLKPNTRFRGTCLYKTGKCKRERALKSNGQSHNLCNMHRLRQNQNQRKLDEKNRRKRLSQCPISTVIRGEHHINMETSANSISPYSLDNSFALQSSASYDVPTFSPSFTSISNGPLSSLHLPIPSYFTPLQKEQFKTQVLQKLIHLISEDLLYQPHFNTSSSSSPSCNISSGPPNDQTSQTSRSTTSLTYILPSSQNIQ